MTEPPGLQGRAESPVRGGPRRARWILFGLVITLAGLVVLNQLAFEAAMRFLAAEAQEARAGRFALGDEALRLLFVGDSYTAGELSESGQGYWAYVPEELAALGYPRPVETVSIALAGSTTWFHTRQVASWLTESGQRPHYVMTIGSVNDGRAYEFQRRYCDSEEGRTDAPAVCVLYAGPRSLLFPLNYLGMRLSPAQYMDEAHDAFGPLRWWWERNDPYRQWLPGATGKAFEALFDQARSQDLRVLAGSYHDPLWSVGMPEAAQRLEVPFFDLAIVEVQAAFEAQGMLTEDRWHPNDAGHRYLAKRWARWFMDSVEPAHSADPVTQP